MKNTQKNKICILAAGRGSRCKVTEGLHKALLPINNRPMISNIFDCIPDNFDIVIAVGYKSDQIISYVKSVYPKKRVTFVHINNYDGEGSGPGLSLLKCKDYLQCPFSFMPVDTYTPGFYFEEISENWVGAVDPPKDVGASYCTISGDSKVKRIGYGAGDFVFNGIAGIFDYEDFWKNLENKNLIKKEHQVINGLSDLKKLKIKYFNDFYDTGNTKSYLQIRSALSKEIVLPKDSECIYIDNGKVIKYFSDENKMFFRVKRAEILKDFVPNVEKINENMYLYDYVEADLLSNIKSEETLDSFLEFLNNKIHKNRYQKNEEFAKNCNSMYKEKTESRAGEFFGSEIDKIKKINGIEVIDIEKIINSIDWNSVYKKAISTDIHGDLQPENILYNRLENKFILIDWRESFGDSISGGDMYYDLSKLYHALLINGTYVLDGNYGIEICDKEAFLTYSIKSNLLLLLEKLNAFCVKNKYDWNNVVLLGILHYINIAPFYKNYNNGKYSDFIFLLGKYLLTKHLNNIGNKNGL